jgi:hypothetical protein
MGDVIEGGTGIHRRETDTRRSFWKNAGLLVASVAFSLVLVEIAYRVISGLPVFRLTDWRTEQVVLKRIGDRAMVDPVLGWTLKPWIDREDFRTMAHGIRTNFGEMTVRTGAVLAVGDSFAEGWDVDDNESWPAYLEGMIHKPVVNGAVFGYGTDQIVLRAEQLLPIVKPKILLVGFVEYDIYRAAHSDFGGPKPYFTLQDGKLRYHPPTPLDRRSQPSFLSTAAGKVRDALGYSAVADMLLKRLAPNYWLAGSKILYRKLDIDGAAITCALLERLKARVEGEGIRMLMFMQHHEYLILGGDVSSENARRVVACAKAMGIEVVDQFASLRAIIKTDRAKAREYYFADEHEGFGHMTPKGNEHAAKLLAAALAGMKR